MSKQMNGNMRLYTEVCPIWKEAKLPSDREAWSKVLGLPNRWVNSRAPNIKQVHLCAYK